ncbi:IS21 family transposase, partial [Sphingobacterium thalpophilum]|uniref:IS21 family transposase n=1 Tax=Sphingobacterium thalpophilum TaxID=259 RepID=UPI0004815453
MSQIKQLIRLKQQGYAIKAIARCLSLSKNTVKTYLFKIGQAKLNMNELLELEDPILDGLLNAGNPAYRDARFEDFKERLSYFQQELGRPGVTRKLLWEEYKQSVSDGYELSQFCFHLGQYLKVQKRSSMVMEHTPADKLYIDFSGKKLHYIDGNTGEIINCEIFVACLPFSNYCYATAVPSQKTPDFLDALDRCIQFLGGVPRCIVPDNLKSAVIKSDRYEPEINRCMEDLANHYATVIIPARAGKPRDKSAVENHVKIIYTQVFAKLRNRSFFSLS